MTSPSLVKLAQKSIREDVYDMSRKKYDSAFKQTVAGLYCSGISVSQLSSDYGVSQVTIYKWIKLHSPIEGTKGLTAAKAAMIQRENLYLKQQVAMLKRTLNLLKQNKE